MLESLKSVEWTHYHHPSFGACCIVLRVRGGVRGFLFGTHRILMWDGYIGWCHKCDIDEIKKTDVQNEY